MRVAIPISDRRVAPVVDCAPSFLVVDLKGRGRIEFFETPFRSWSQRERAEELAAYAVEVVLCDRISHALGKMILARGMAVVEHVSGNVDEVLDTYRERKKRDPRLFCRTSPSVEELGEVSTIHTRA